jgi:hypothetical protein
MEQRSKPALLVGDYVPLRSRNDILTFKRVWQGEEVLVALNVASQPRAGMARFRNVALLDVSRYREEADEGRKDIKQQFPARSRVPGD